MTDDAGARWRRLAPVVAAVRGAGPSSALCVAAAGVLGVAGVSLAVMSDGAPAPLAWSDATGARLAELQMTLGEGPSLDAHATGRPVSEPDLAHPDRSRWPAFGPAALQAGVGALFALPLRMGGVRVGALTLHRPGPGDLSGEQRGDARAIANVATVAMLSLQADAGADLGPDLEMLAGYGAAVHQATGMVSVQLGVGTGEALVRLRAHAFAEGRTVTEVAGDVVAGRLRLDGVGR